MGTSLLYICTLPSVSRGQKGQCNNVMTMQQTCLEHEHCAEYALGHTCCEQEKGDPGGGMSLQEHTGVEGVVEGKGPGEGA